MVGVSVPPSGETPISGVSGVMGGLLGLPHAAKARKPNVTPATSSTCLIAFSSRTQRPAQSGRGKHIRLEDERPHVLPCYLHGRLEDERPHVLPCYLHGRLEDERPHVLPCLEKQTGLTGRKCAGKPRPDREGS